MIDISKIKYRLVIMDENGKQYNIKDFVDTLGWEEPKNQLATRITFTCRNTESAEIVMDQVAKIGCLVGVFASLDGGNDGLDDEVARGYITMVKPKSSLDQEMLTIRCYDDLYNLQQSEDNMFFSEGMDTEDIISHVFTTWGIPMETYDGPHERHAKKAYKTEKLSDIVLDTLDDAAKKGAAKCIVRANKGRISVLPRGSNQKVYCFDVTNATAMDYSISTEGMVTRVKIIGKEDDDGKTSVEAVLDGKTEFGVRQEIKTRSEDDSLEDAKTEAQQLLDEEGIPQKDISLKSPDIPWVRKGDLIYINGGYLKGYYYIAGISHDAENGTMDMDIEEATPETVSEEKTKDYQVGDIVNFHGGTHYVSSYDGSAGYHAGAGPAKITIIAAEGRAHRYHLIHTDSSSNVYGWVDAGTFD